MTHLNWLTDDVIARLSAADKAPDGTVTMVFTDIVNSTEIKRLLPGNIDTERDTAWVERFQKPHHTIIRTCIDDFEGFEVKTIGDAFFITFVDPAKAILCAVEIQKRMAAANLITPLSGSPPLQVRIGIHTGTPIRQDTDYVGTSVDKAARVESAAHGGQVLLSEQTYTLVKDQLSDLRFHSHGEFLLKGLGEHPHLLFEVLWDGKTPTSPYAQRPPTETRDEPLTVEIPADFPDDKFASDLKTLLMATRPDPMRPQEWEKAKAVVTEEWLLELGKRLFLSLFDDDNVHKRYWETTGEVRLKIPSKFDALPFELLHDGRDFIALRRGIVRLVDVDMKGRRPRKQAKGALKVLVALAAPVLDERLPADHEYQPHVFDVDRQSDIFRALRNADFAAEFRLLPHSTQTALDEALLEDKPAVLHFVGHGSEGTLLFETRHGGGDSADHTEIERLISEADSLQMVVLESCLTASGGVDVSVAGAMLAGGVPLVIAMQHLIAVEAATEFVRAFYRRLTLSGDLYEALLGARRAVQRRRDLSVWEWSTPVLFWDGKSEIPNLKSQIPNQPVVVNESPRPNLDLILRRDPIFVGRRKERVDIARTLDPLEAGMHNVVVLQAAGGFGKTALAREVVHRIAGWFDGGVIFAAARTHIPDDPIVRLSAAGRVTPIENDVDFLVQLGRKLGLELTGNEPPDQLPTILARSLDDGKWRLLILDNLDDIYNSPHLCNFLEILPRTARAIVTSRHNILAAGTLPLPVEPLPLRDAAEMGFAFGKSASFIPMPKQMEKLLKLTGGNPLAIKLALNTVGESRTPFDDFLRDLEEAGGTAEKLFRYLFDRSLTVAGDDGARVFKAMSLFATHASREALKSVCAFASDEEFSNAMARVVRLNLIDSVFDGEAFIIQEIARYYSARLLQEDTAKDALQEQFISWFAKFMSVGTLLNPGAAQQYMRGQMDLKTTAEKVNETAHQVVVNVLEYLDVELANCICALTFACELGDLSAVIKFENGLMKFFMIRSYWSYWEKITQLILATYCSSNNANTQEGKKRIGIALCHLGVAYGHQRRWLEAKECIQKSLVILQEIGDRVEEGRIFMNLGNVYQGQERWTEAEECYQKSLAILREIGDRVNESGILNNLGLIYENQGRLDEAAECFKKSLTIYQEFGYRIGEGETLRNLGTVYGHQGQWAKAEECFQKSLEICQEIGDRVGEGGTLENLAVLRAKQGDITEALEFGRQAVAVLEKTEDKAGLEKARRLVAEWQEQIAKGEA